MADNLPITSSNGEAQLAAEDVAGALHLHVKAECGATSGPWPAFGSAPVVGQGTHLPGQGHGLLRATAAVTAINESGGMNGPVGFTE